MIAKLINVIISLAIANEAIFLPKTMARSTLIKGVFIRIEIEFPHSSGTMAKRTYIMPNATA